MQRTKFNNLAALGAVFWIGIGAWWGGMYVSNYFERPHWAYLLIATAYFLFGVAMAITTFVLAPANKSRFTRKQVLLARILPFAPLAVASIGVAVRWA